MPLSVSISYTTSFPSIPDDIAPELAAGSEGTGGIIIFNSVYESTKFGINLQFSYQPEELQIIVPKIVSISMTGPRGANYTTSGSTVSINGNLSNIFNEEWEFVLKDGRVQRLPINNSEDWVAITRWYPATFSEQRLEYLFTVTLDNDEVLTLTIPQYAYWRWQISLSKFKDFVSKGQI
jgi:hypothetical protein